jgi:hypothetical protein
MLVVGGASTGLNETISSRRERLGDAVDTRTPPYANTKLLTNNTLFSFTVTIPTQDEENTSAALTQWAREKKRFTR